MSEAMKKRMVAQTVVLYRDKERVVPEVGKPFLFTEAELKSIGALNPDALTKIVNSEEPEQTSTNISLDEHNALLEQARIDAVEQFKLTQGQALMESKNATEQTGAAPATDATPESDSKNGKGGKGTSAGKNAQPDDDI